MLEISNRKYNTDSYPMAVMRVIFMKWMKKKGQWVNYKLGVSRSKSEYHDAWLHPATPADFLGLASILYETYEEWDEFLCSIRDYFSSHLPILYMNKEIRSIR